MRTSRQVVFTLGLILASASAACVVGDEPAPTSDHAPFALRPVGWFDAISDAGVASGWARDPDDGGRAIDVHFYVYGPTGAVVQVYGLTANQYRADVGAHAWSVQIPAAYRAVGYRFRAFGIDAVGGDGNRHTSTNAASSRRRARASGGPPASTSASAVPASRFITKYGRPSSSTPRS